MIDDCYINNLANNQVSAVFHFPVIRRMKCVTQVDRALYGVAMFVPFVGAQRWRP